MTNLLQETISILKENGKTLGDVLWIGCKSFKISKEKFIELADKDYYSGYGIENVAEDLLVVGDDFWLERHSYDGSEWWEFKKVPKEPFLEIDFDGFIIRPEDIYGDRELIEQIGGFKNKKLTSLNPKSDDIEFCVTPKPLIGHVLDCKFKDMADGTVLSVLLDDFNVHADLIIKYKDDEGFCYGEIFNVRKKTEL